jgi:hypothetical protein
MTVNNNEVVRELEPIKIEINNYQKSLMLGARVNGILGKQAYRKIINIAEKDFDGLKSIHFFLGTLIETIEEEGLH